MSVNVGVIGLGALGRPIAELLLKAGHRVAVYDVREEPVTALKKAGAQACTCPAEVAQHSDMIISLVLDGAQTDEIIFGATGMLGSLERGNIVALGSTLSPAPVKKIAAVLAAKGIDTLDMPISGGIVAAREGKLSLMVGGVQAVLDRALPVLRVFANEITRTGEVGSGQAAKLAHQLVFATNVMALLEGLSLGVAGGVEPAALKQVFKNGLANSTVLQVWDDLGPRWKGMLEATPPDAMPPNMRKDLHLVLEFARELGVNLYLGTQASMIADAGVATGHDSKQF
ncbi:MAG: 2-hydroxy-3-oxopropionate reductase [Betaproteobacteria bacterium]|nr:2-hydroxy-3-oxopropionate reductase [Betaproteobacteria bacterium]